MRLTDRYKVAREAVVGWRLARVEAVQDRLNTVSNTGSFEFLNSAKEIIMSSFNRIAKTLVTSAMLVLFAAASTGAMATETKWEKHHARRDQVNDRLQHQNRRIHQEVKEGDLTKKQARALHRKDRQIRREERTMASQNGGHVTKVEQKALNQQENAVSKQIGK